MKLQSQETKRFEVRELRALANKSRLPRSHAVLWWAACGWALGFLIVAVLRILKR